LSPGVGHMDRRGLMPRVDEPDIGVEQSVVDAHDMVARYAEHMRYARLLQGKREQACTLHADAATGSSAVSNDSPGRTRVKFTGSRSSSMAPFLSRATENQEFSTSRTSGKSLRK